MSQSLLPKPRFWAEAGLQKNTRFTVFGELLTFMLVFFIAEMMQSFIYNFITTFYLLSSAEDIFLYDESGAVDVMATALNLLNNPPPWAAAVMLLTSFTLALAAVFYCRKFEKRSIQTMGLCGKTPLGEYALGLVIGLALFAAVLGVGVAAGGFTVIRRDLSSAAVGMLPVFILGFIVQGAAEELMLRGYLATSLGARLPVPFAALVSSVLFAALHASASSFDFLASVNTFLMGLLLCIYMIKRGSIWGACAIHSMWNIAQGCIFGLPVSGVKLTGSIVEVSVRNYRSAITGGDYGPEASICATVVLLAALGLVLALRAKDPAPVPASDQAEDVTQERM